jgi:hypothetical protein
VIAVKNSILGTYIPGFTGTNERVPRCRNPQRHHQRRHHQHAAGMERWCSRRLLQRCGIRTVPVSRARSVPQSDARWMLITVPDPKPGCFTFSSIFSVPG